MLGQLPCSILSAGRTSRMSDDEAQARLDNHLSRMLEATQLARQYAQGVSKDEFLKGRRTQQAVVLTKTQ